MSALWVILDYTALRGYDKPKKKEGLCGHGLSQFVNMLRFQGPSVIDQQWKSMTTAIKAMATCAEVAQAKRQLLPKQGE